MRGILSDQPLLQGLDERQRARIERRFWSHVEVDGDCWIWTGHRQHDGYGRTTVLTDAGTRRSAAAHRLSYELYVEVIPSHRFLDHTCRRRDCVRPGHLQAVLAAVNVRRSTAPAATTARNRLVPATKTHCPHGHEFTAENSGVAWVDRERGLSQRYCRECRRRVNRESRARKRLEGR